MEEVGESELFSLFLKIPTYYQLLYSGYWKLKPNMLSQNQQDVSSVLEENQSDHPHSAKVMKAGTS